MLILDTNVVSESMRVTPYFRVIEWLDAQVLEELFVTAITEAEIRRGIAILPIGQRRRNLEAAAERTFRVFFSERILPFDSDAASAYAIIASDRRAADHPISQLDCQIAAIARAKGASIVSRDTSGFEGCEFEIVNPWLVGSEP